jgi:hypothetical protein
MLRPTFGPFNIDTDSSDEQYLYVDVPSKNLTIAVKLDDEGIVVDVFPLGVASQPIATLGITYEEVQDGRKRCYHCGEPMIIGPHELEESPGVSHHVTPDGDIDFTADADHTALDDAEFT